MLEMMLAAVVCASVEKCAAAAQSALGAGRLERAEQAALTGLRLAECGPDDGPPSHAEEVLARIALRRGEPLLARAWLVGQPEAPSLKREVDAAVARLPPLTGPSGRYSQALEAGLWDEVTVTAKDAGHIHFKLEGARINASRCEHPELFTGGDLSSVVPGLAELEGDAALQGEAYVFESREFVASDDDRPCRLTFRFTANALSLDQDTRGEDCGFGYGVNAGGDYVRTK